MTDAPPQLGDIPHRSELKLPTLQANMDSNTNGSTSIQNAKDSIYNSVLTRSCVTHLIMLTFDIRYPIRGGHHTKSPDDAKRQGGCPVAESVKAQHAKTTAEFQNLADSRAPPNKTAITGQPLTHYHSFFYNLLSWDNPRATAISFLSNVLLILAVRYLPTLQWAFKLLYLILGAAAAAEVTGKLIFSQGLAASFRPRKYYTIPRETLEASLEDLEQLINFFIIEFQRILFAENVVHTVAAFLAAFLSYWLVKILPLWGLSLVGVSVIYLGPLIYVSNKEIIDRQIEHLTMLINSQANQVRDLAGHHAGRASETVKSYAGDYSAKAQEYIGAARGRAASLEFGKSSNPPSTSGPANPPSYTSNDFPHAPKQDPIHGVTSHQEQYENSEFGGKTEPVS